MNRRQALLGLGLTPVAASVLARVARGQDDRVDDDGRGGKDKVPILFAQTAVGVVLADNVLKLIKPAAATVFFSEGRRHRFTGHVPTDVFVNEWGEGDDSFGYVPPSATLSILSGPMAQEIVVTLKNPRFDAGDLLYDVEVTDGEPSATGDACSLFIDMLAYPLEDDAFDGRCRRVERLVPARRW